MSHTSPILAFDHVTWGGHPPLTFGLGPGELCILRLDATDHEAVSHIGLLACGLLEPDLGHIRFQGEDWRTMEPTRAENCRSLIGRVFSGTAWISNLDVDENILLAALHHRRGTRAELERRALRLARAFGLPNLPRVRPALLAARDLQRAQWIRALLTEPVLLVLEEPLRHTMSSDQEALLAELVAHRRRGGAALWITTQPSTPSGLEPATTVTLRPLHGPANTTSAVDEERTGA